MADLDGILSLVSSLGGVLGVIAMFGLFQGTIINIIIFAALILIAITMMTAGGNNLAIPGAQTSGFALIVLAFIPLVIGLFIINPSFLNQIGLQSVSSIVSTQAVETMPGIFTYSIFSTIPVTQTPIGAANPILYWSLIASLAFGILYALIKLSKKRIKLPIVGVI